MPGEEAKATCPQCGKKFPVEEDHCDKCGGLLE